MIKAVVFDFGGVIYINEGGSILRLLADAMSIPFEELRQTYFKFNHLANVHNMPWEDMAVEVVKEFDASAEAEAKARGVFRDWGAKNYFNKELLDMLPRIRAAGYKVAILSNAGTPLRKKLEDEGIAQLVDEIIISGEIGHQKPHKEAFDPLFEKLGVSPEEVVFIDDSEKSLEKAGEIGYVPILFRGNDKLLADLINLGITI